MLISLYPAVQVFSSGARMFCSRKHMLKLEKRGENGVSQKEQGFPSFALAPTVKVTIFTLPNPPPS